MKFFLSQSWIRFSLKSALILKDILHPIIQKFYTIFRHVLIDFQNFYTRIFLSFANRVGLSGQNHLEAIIPGVANGSYLSISNFQKVLYFSLIFLYQFCCEYIMFFNNFHLILGNFIFQINPAFFLKKIFFEFFGNQWNSSCSGYHQFINLPTGFDQDSTGWITESDIYPLNYILGQKPTSTPEQMC